MHSATFLQFPKAVIFDMDGTLTRPNIDYDGIKRAIGISSGPILEGLMRMVDVERLKAEAILHQHEDRFARESSLNDGCEALLRWLDHAGVTTALVTRNTRASVNTVFGLHNLKFDVAITREDGKYKPDPAPLQLACQQMGVAIGGTWMVGDSRHDIEAAEAAGMASVWISHGVEPDFPAVPTVVVKTLPELQQLLQEMNT